MKIVVSPKARLFKVHWYTSTHMTCYCIARTSEEAIQTTRREYNMLPANSELSAEKLRRNDPKDSWKWFEFCLKNKGQRKPSLCESLICATSVLSVTK